MFRCISLAFAGATGLAAILMPVPDASAMPPTIATQFAGAGILTVGGACNAYSCRNYSGVYWMPYYVGTGPTGLERRPKSRRQESPEQRQIWRAASSLT
ncbi:hypothetical protein C7449_11410 [Mycoplana dimorpha]|uniref:Uncharacterized protein n=1 Tax=Mycoplana dimorpha TaxID=28320 RepID=A0A2T5AKB5_MYCDI|nr:hypothetical protein C7449_11410 [Mycoplana dimorpha]